MDSVKMPFESIDGGKVYLDTMEGSANQGILIIDNVSSEMLKQYIDQHREMGYYIEENETSVNIYKDGLMMFMIKDGEKIYPYIYTGNVKADREVSLSKARDMVEDKGLLKDDEYFKNYCVIAIENASVREQGLFEFVVISARNDQQIYNMPYYMITDGKEILLFEQEIWTPYYPASACFDSNKLMLTYVRSEQGDGEKCYISTYLLEDNEFVKQEEKFVGTDIRLVGKIEKGEYKLYELKLNSDESFPLERKNIWIIDKEYDMKE